MVKRGPDPTHEQIVRGILLRIGAVACFSVMVALLKLTAQRGMNAPEMMFYRSLAGMPVVVVWVMHRTSLSDLRPNRPVAHIWRSGFGLVSMVLTFQALILLPLAEATTINFTAPVFSTILSWLVLRELVGPHRWMAVVIGFIGVLVVARPGGSSLPMLGVAVGLAAAFGQATVTVMLRRLQHSEPIAAIVFWFAAAGTVVGGLLLPIFGQSHDVATYLLVAAAGTCGGIAQLMMTASLQAPVSVVTPFDYLQLVGAIILGWLLFASVPSVYTVLGASLIASSGLYTAWREHVRRRVASPVTPVGIS